MSTQSPDAVRDQVRRRYAEAALAAAAGSAATCCADSCCTAEAATEEVVRAAYTIEERGELPEAATLASLGCGNPTAVAELNDGETVLDLGSGGVRGRDLCELRDQPLRAHARRLHRDGACPAAGRADRDQRYRRRGSPERFRASRARQLRRLHRGCALEGRVRGRPRGGGLRGRGRRVRARGWRRHA